MRHAPLPSLANLQMELRKCCNHPFLIRGVEAAEAAASVADVDDLEALVRASGKMLLLDKLLPKLKRRGHTKMRFAQRLSDELNGITDFHRYPYANMLRGAIEETV